MQGVSDMISDPVWTSPPKSYLMASPILITMHPAADRDQMPHGGEHGRGDKNDALAPIWHNRIEYNICSCDELSVESLGQNQLCV